jgi:hypothetical protein
MITQSNSKIFTNRVFGTGTDEVSTDLISKNIDTQQVYLESSSYSNLNTRLPRVPSNQRIAKD